jgi:dinuclear metal center YbgI/SA1388 family protein
MATVGDIQQILERWAPQEFAMEGDNPGLQCGTPGAIVRGILLTLDVTEQVVNEAHRRGANVLVSHHPLIFSPLRSVDLETPQGKLIGLLTRRSINLVAAHTNLDFTRGGTSFALAEHLGLEQVQFLHTPFKTLAKVVSYVPSDAVDRVAHAMADAGGGTIGNYDLCSFRTTGTGTFRGNDQATPTAGIRGMLERVEEVRLEMLVPSHRVRAVIQAMKAVHPYEEVAHDVYPLENPTTDAGMGALGTLQRPMQLDAFLKRVKSTLKTTSLRCSARGRRTVRTVAVCGGSGSRLLDEAIRRQADVFVTADVKYHAFHDAGDRIVLVDAGHFETEYPVLAPVAQYLRAALGASSRRIAVSIAARSKNPVFYV